jgi:hypothetical protein
MLLGHLPLNHSIIEYNFLEKYILKSNNFNLHFSIFFQTPKYTFIYLTCFHKQFFQLGFLFEFSNDLNSK